MAVMSPGATTLPRLGRGCGLVLRERRRARRGAGAGGWARAAACTELRPAPPRRAPGATLTPALPPRPWVGLSSSWLPRGRALISHPSGTSGIQNGAPRWSSVSPGRAKAGPADRVQVPRQESEPDVGPLPWPARLGCLQLGFPQGSAGTRRVPARDVCGPWRPLRQLWPFAHRNHLLRRHPGLPGAARPGLLAPGNRPPSVQPWVPCEGSAPRLILHCEAPPPRAEEAPE